MDELFGHFPLFFFEAVDGREEGVGVFGEALLVEVVEVQAVEGDHEAGEAVEEDPIAWDAVGGSCEVVDHEPVQCLQGYQGGLLRRVGRGRRADGYEFLEIDLCDQYSES